jgi:catechol 2,3-dioxygenase-like lactoylglutathione lyase family enzyme
MSDAPRTGLLHHVEIYVSDLKRSNEFWGWFLGRLGYEKVAEWLEGVSYELGDTYLVFVQAEKKHLDVPYHRCRVGLNHLAFHARSRRHVDEMTEELKRRGARVLYGDRHPYAGGPDYYAVFFEDPDRVKVELVAPALREGEAS